MVTHPTHIQFKESQPYHIPSSTGYINSKNICPNLLISFNNLNWMWDGLLLFYNVCFGFIIGNSKTFVKRLLYTPIPLLSTFYIHNWNTDGYHNIRLGVYTYLQDYDLPDWPRQIYEDIHWKNYWFFKLNENLVAFTSKYGDDSDFVFRNMNKPIID